MQATRIANAEPRLSPLAAIASCLGVILSVSAAVYTTTQYFALVHNAKLVEVLAPSEDVIAPKIEAMLTGHENKKLILSELKARQEHNSSLHAAMTRLVADSKIRTLNGTLLLIGVSVIFAVLLIRIEASRRSEKRMTKPTVK